MHTMKRKVLVLVLVSLSWVATASAQFGFGGIVFDPTNYANALLRYYQLEQHLIELKNSYAELVTQYNLALQMSRNLQNMPARYRAQFSQWRDAFAPDTYGNTGAWVSGINSGLFSAVNTGYQLATTRLLPYSANQLSSMNSGELSRVHSQYATVELTDGANTTAMATIGAIRGSAQDIQTQIGNLEQDSLASDPGLNTEVAVLNKINAAGVLTLRTVQDSNKLLASLLEEQTILAKQQRESTANTINADIDRQANMATNMAQVSGTLTNSLQSFRMP
jgi:type IV secretion system protein TrbJ